MASPFSLPVNIKVASIQYRAFSGNKTDNVRSLSCLVNEAAVNGAKIIVLPEMCTTGFNIENSKEAGILAEQIPGPSTTAFSKLATLYKVYLVLGLAEHDLSTNKFYNTQIVLGPNGQTICKYRKINLFGSDQNWAEVGDLGYKTVDTEWGRIGLGICFDINCQDFVEFISGAKVNILAFSTNWVGAELPFNYWSEMVANGGYYFIAANNWGKEEDIIFSGGSIILSPDLLVLSQSTASTNIILYANIEINRS
jgi:predicted amidohydrolase